MHIWGQRGYKVTQKKSSENISALRVLTRSKFIWFHVCLCSAYKSSIHTCMHLFTIRFIVLIISSIQISFTQFFFIVKECIPCNEVRNGNTVFVWCIIATFAVYINWVHAFDWVHTCCEYPHLCQPIALNLFKIESVLLCGFQKLAG